MTSDLQRMKRYRFYAWLFLHSFIVTNCIWLYSDYKKSKYVTGLENRNIMLEVKSKSDSITIYSKSMFNDALVDQVDSLWTLILKKKG